MEKNSEPSQPFRHKTKWFLTKVVRSFNGGKTVFPKTVLAALDIHMPRNEAQFSSVTQSCLTLCDPVDWSTPDLPVHHQLLEFTQTHIHWVGDAIQPSHPLLIHSPPIFNLSQHQGLFKWGSSLYWSFSLGISPSTKYSELIAFRMDSLNLPAVQWTLKSLLQHHSSKASIHQCSAFFIVQLHIHTWLLQKPQLWLDGPLLAK